MAFRFFFQPIALSVSIVAAEAVEHEDNCLLQSHRKQHKQWQPLSSPPTLLQTSAWQTATSGQPETTHKHGSVVLFDQLAALAEQDSQLSPTDAQMVDEVAVMLEEVSIPALHTAHESDQQQVIRVASEVESCDNERDIVAQSPGGLASQEPALEAARSTHRQCRQSELVMHTAVASTCGELEDLILNLSPPDPTPPQPQVPSQNFSDYLIVNDEFFATAYVRYVELSGLCTTDQVASAPMQAQCTQAQLNFEQQFCVTSSLASATCEVYNSCRTSREAEVAATREGVEHLVMSRKLEFVTLMKIKCLIRYLLQEDAEGAAIAHECGTLRLEIHYDGSDFDPGMFNITFPPVSEANPCAPGPTSPCDDAFRFAEYAGLDGLEPCSTCQQGPSIILPPPKGSTPSVAAPETPDLPTDEELLSAIGVLDGPPQEPIVEPADPPPITFEDLGATVSTLQKTPALAALQMWAANITARVKSAAAAIQVSARHGLSPAEEVAPPTDEKALGIVLEALG